MGKPIVSNLMSVESFCSIGYSSPLLSNHACFGNRTLKPFSKALLIPGPLWFIFHFSLHYSCLMHTLPPNQVFRHRENLITGDLLRNIALQDILKFISIFKIISSFRGLKASFSDLSFKNMPHLNH